MSWPISPWSIDFWDTLYCVYLNKILLQETTYKRIEIIIHSLFLQQTTEKKLYGNTCSRDFPLRGSYAYHNKLGIFLRQKAP